MDSLTALDLEEADRISPCMLLAWFFTCSDPPRRAATMVPEERSVLFKAWISFDHVMLWCIQFCLFLSQVDVLMCFLICGIIHNDKNVDGECNLMWFVYECVKLWSKKYQTCCQLVTFFLFSFTSWWHIILKHRCCATNWSISIDPSKNERLSVCRSSNCNLRQRTCLN